MNKKPLKEKVIRANWRVKPEQLKKVIKEAKAQQCSQSEIIRWLIDYYL